MTSSTPHDDLEAVRIVVGALQGLDVADQRRVLRWAQEKLGLLPVESHAPDSEQARSRQKTGELAAVISDIRSFLNQKAPGSDTQFAATVAYFYAFEVPESARKPEIVPADLQEAARLAGRARLRRPIDTLNNALKAGYLDRGSARGTFRINTVGENLVAMALPAGNGRGAQGTPKPRRSGPRRPGGRTAKKKSAR